MAWGPIRMLARDRLRPAPNLPTGGRRGRPRRSGPAGRSIDAVRRAVACVVAAAAVLVACSDRRPELTLRHGRPCPACPPRPSRRPSTGRDARRRRPPTTTVAGAPPPAVAWQACGERPRVRHPDGPARLLRPVEGHDRPLRGAAEGAAGRTSASARCSSTRAARASPARSWSSRPALAFAGTCATGSTSSAGTRAAPGSSIPVDCVDDLDPFLIGADPTPDAPDDQKQAADAWPSLR